VVYAVPLIALLGSVKATYWTSDALASTAAFAAERTIGGGVVSSAATTVCLLGAMYIPVVWSLQRLSALGYGYATLARGSQGFRQLLGSSDDIERLAKLLDEPTRQLPRLFLVVIVTLMGIIAGLFLFDVATVEGPAFSVFLGVSSLLGGAAALVLLTQSLEVWRQLRHLLQAMANLPLASAIERVGLGRLRWNLSILAPDTRDLRLLVEMVKDLRVRTGNAEVAAVLGPPVAAAIDDVLRHDEDSSAPGHVVSLTQSATWLRLWQLADVLVPLLDANRWGHGVKPRVTSAPGAAAASATEECLDLCETLLAAERALVLRVITARIMAGLFSGMVILGLLTAGHLLYVFQGRASLLTLDVTAIALASLAAVWMLLGMERDAVLSLIWQTTPGRLNFNWAFVQRLLVYGVVPLLIVVGSLFPEVGAKLVRLIEPLRKLTSM
jgi:hypothetical protein